MAINFPDSPSNGDTYVAAGKTFTYNSTRDSWSVAAGGASVTTYATIDDLPLSGQSNGAQAFVTGTNRLYIWSDSGWYNIALINTTPSISNVESSYTLSNEGANTFISIVAEDPEGIPITYSIASDTSGDIATVTQGSGNTANEFTITPSTNTALDGQSFSLTFRASDGVNIATALSTFTLSFDLSISNSNYTTALITSVGTNNQVNNTFTDSSTNSHTITTVGDATQSTFSPYRSGGYSTYFGGGSDNLTTASAVLSTSGAFTVQCWVRLDSTANQAIWAQGTSGNSQRASLSVESGNWYAQIGSAVINTTAAVAKVWKFLEFQYDGSQIELFVDGTSVGTASNSTNAQNTGFFIGKLWAANYNMVGYVTDLRVINGTPSGSSSVPSSRLEAITNTTFLGCHLPYIADGSTNSHSITVNGNTKTEPFAPYDYETYASGTHGGSMYFDGTGDRLTFSHASDFSFGTGDFTIEFWIKTPTNAITGGYSRTICEIGQLHIYMRITAYHGGVDSAIRVYDETGDNDIGNVAIADDRWHHVAVVRESGTMKCWVDGKYNTGVSNSRNLSETSTNAIGGRTDGNGHMQGTVADLRVVKGTAVYTGTSNFIPPTAPLTAITNTTLLLSGTNAGIIDKSQSAQSLTLTGDVQSSTTQTKYLSSSIYFDGSGDYISTDPIVLTNTEPFTIEMWYYNTSSGTGEEALICQRNSASPYNGWRIYNNQSATNQLRFYNGTGWVTIESNLAKNQWHHIAVVSQGSGTNQGQCYLNGTAAGSAFTTSSSINHSADLHIGTDNAVTSRTITGYLSDVRITKGLARYTSAFTPPTAALEG